MRCVFFGHRTIYNKNEILNRVYDQVVKCIKSGFNEFLMGCHGDFDKICLSACRKARQTYPFIKIIIVLTSLSKLNKDKLGFSDVDQFNDVETMTYELEEIYFKQKITINNRFMINDSDLVIAYLRDYKKYGGVWLAVNYAQKKRKPIINLYSSEDKIFS